MNQDFSGQRGVIRVMERFGVSLTGHHPVDQIERWEQVHVEMIPRVVEGVFKDCLRVWNQGAIQGKLRIEVCCE